MRSTSDKTLPMMLAIPTSSRGIHCMTCHRMHASAHLHSHPAEDKRVSLAVRQHICKVPVGKPSKEQSHARHQSFEVTTHSSIQTVALEGLRLASKTRQVCISSLHFQTHIVHTIGNPTLSRAKTARFQSQRTDITLNSPSRTPK
jgi:hypothetical protein